ncbi:MAG TPA: 30S ribosomal protein S16 [Candidatus Yonathbacteria bacterium]|nr:30S ribosomal protein S16 [Candidatus Yonathbacteria bacterium]
MLKVRLQRTGKKNDPSFRLVVTESQNGPQSGKFLEVLGNLDIKKGNAQINAERVKYWIANGAQVSDTVHNLLISEKIIEGKKINVLPKKSPIIKEKTEDEKKEEASAVEPEKATEVADEPKAEEKPVVEKKEDKSVVEEIAKEAPVEEEPEKPKEETKPDEEKTEEAPEEEKKV